MPRLAKTEREKQLDAVAKRIQHYYDDTRRERKLDCYTAARAMGLSYDTMLRKISNPSRFTLGELQSVANAMNISLFTLISGKEAEA